jgi:hypothetical protein
MYALPPDTDAVVLRKWTRTYRYRCFAWIVFAILAVMSGSIGIWQLAETISEGRNMHLTLLETLCPSSPRVEPLDGFRLLTMELQSYLMFGVALFSITMLFVIRRDARRYQVVMKLLSGAEKGVVGKEKD